MKSSVSVRIGLACGVATLVAMGGTAQAQEGVAIKNLLGSIGLVPKEKDPIRYRERAPLVIPPKSQLPPPASPESYASANPQWPNDPDVVAKRRRTEDERRPVTWSETRRMQDRDDRLSVDELRATGRAPAKARQPSYMTERAQVLTPEEMRATERRQAEADPEGKEPARRTLTDPPTGMRKTAMGGAVKRDFQPPVDQQTEAANPMNWLRKQFTSDDDE